MDIWYMNELERLESMRVALPAMDRDLPFQTASFFSFFIPAEPNLLHGAYQDSLGLPSI